MICMLENTDFHEFFIFSAGIYMTQKARSTGIGCLMSHIYTCLRVYTATNESVWAWGNLMNISTFRHWNKIYALIITLSLDPWVPWIAPNKRRTVMTGCTRFQKYPKCLQVGIRQSAGGLCIDNIRYFESCVYIQDLGIADHLSMIELKVYMSLGFIYDWSVHNYYMHDQQCPATLIAIERSQELSYCLVRIDIGELIRIHEKRTHSINKAPSSILYSWLASSLSLW